MGRTKEDSIFVREQLNEIYRQLRASDSTLISERVDRDTPPTPDIRRDSETLLEAVAILISYLVVALCGLIALVYWPMKQLWSFLKWFYDPLKWWAYIAMLGTIIGIIFGSFALIFYIGSNSGQPRACYHGTVMNVTEGEVLLHYADGVEDVYIDNAHLLFSPSDPIVYTSDGWTMRAYNPTHPDVEAICSFVLPEYGVSE